VDTLMSEGISRTAAVKQVARDLGMARNDVYDIASRG